MIQAIKEIPKIGFGLWKIPKEICTQSVYEAIKLWYRHFDSASDYGNEKEVWEWIKKAIQDWLVTREQLWITSKLWNTYHEKQHVLPALKKTLDDLQLDYLDNYMIHFPIALKYVDFETRYPAEWLYNPDELNPKMEFSWASLKETWESMEDLVEKKLVKNIWVCNYNTWLLLDLLQYSKIKPYNLQVEIHPYLQQEKIVKFCEIHNIHLTWFSPLWPMSYIELNMDNNIDSLLNNKNIIEISKKYNKKPAQVILKWWIQRGYSIIPKASSTIHMKENLNIFDFELTWDEISEINKININKRFNDPGVFCLEAFNTYCPIYD